MKKKKIDFGSYVFLIPAMVIYLSVLILPIFYSIYISFFKWSGLGPKIFVGFKNYTKLFTKDPIFIIAIKNNLIWTFLTVILTIVVSLGLAVLLNRKFKGRTFFRGFFYFPCIIAPIAASIIWRWIYNPNIGFINELFKAFGSNFQQTWISDPKVSLYATFAASLWQACGLSMILFLAGLQGVSVDVLEAATIDGAGNIRKFFAITIPLLKETFVIVIATLLTSSLKVFDIVQGLTGGGPNNSTQMLSTYMYSQTFLYNNVGTGTAISCIMVLVMLVVIVPYVMYTAKDN